MTLLTQLSDEARQHVEGRLRSNLMIWLTTVSPSGRPESVPVWFLRRDDETLLVYSQPGKPKLRNIRANPAGRTRARRHRHRQRCHPPRRTRPARSDHPTRSSAPRLRRQVCRTDRRPVRHPRAIRRALLKPDPDHPGPDLDAIRQPPRAHLNAAAIARLAR
ncbi:MAG: nitroreductase/quinone reductase family protein [Pseudonocardiaceae bacterium]